MTQLTIEIPDALARCLAWLASEQKKSVEQVAVEQLESLLAPAAESLEAKDARFFQQSGLFVERLAEEKQRYQAVSAARLKELAAKLGQQGLSLKSSLQSETATDAFLPMRRQWPGQTLRG